MLVKALEQNFSWIGLGKSSGKEVVTGRHNKPSVEVESTDRVTRESTSEAMEEAMKKPGPESQAGEKKRGGKTKKSIQGEAS